MTIEVIQASNIAADDPTVLEFRPHLSVSEPDKTVTIQSTPSNPAPIGTFDTLLVVRFKAGNLHYDIPLRVAVICDPTLWTPSTTIVKQTVTVPY